MNPSLREMLKDSLSRHAEIRLAFLFGSVAAGRETPSSDLDIAVLFQDAPSTEQLHSIGDELESKTGKEVDLVVLNDASPIIRMQVLKNGILLINHGTTYEEFFARTVSEYDDLKTSRREIERNIHRGRIYA